MRWLFDCFYPAPFGVQIPQALADNSTQSLGANTKKNLVLIRESVALSETVPRKNPVYASIMPENDCILPPTNLFFLAVAGGRSTVQTMASLHASKRNLSFGRVSRPAAAVNAA